MKRLLLLALWVLTADVLCRPAFAQQPCRPTVEGRLETFTLTSRVFHDTRTIRVWLPPAYDPARKYPVLYIPDGASAFDACTAFRGQELRADETLSELIAAGQVPPLIAVGIDNGSDVVDNSDNGVGRASEFLAGNAQWIIEGCYGELVEMVIGHCTRAIFLNPGLDACVANNRRRPWEPHKYATPEAQDAMLRPLLDWVAGYYTRNDQWSYGYHRRVFDAFKGNKTEVTDLGPGHVA
jgi:hypothetical protein